jgi:hypothetical protein
MQKNVEIDGLDFQDAFDQNVDVDNIQTTTPYLCAVALDLAVLWTSMSIMVS